MGRTRKRYNEKARSNAGASMTRGNEDKIEVVLDTEKEKYDESNPLILSGSKKKAPAIRPKSQPIPRQLSKKQRKKLEKVLARKKKNVNRAELFEKLSQVQAKPEELNFFASTSSIQTCGLKRLGDELNGTKSKKIKINTLKGANKGEESLAKTIKYESSSSESSETEDEKEDECKKSESEDESPEVKEQISEEDKVVEAVEKQDTNPKSLISSEEEKQEKKKEELTVKPSSIPAVYVTVNRKPEIQAAREALPIFCEEQVVIEAIKENPVVLIHGETGSGKTTQVPQFLYEAGFTQNGKMIGITEPRRIAAMSMAARVGEEMNAPEKVSYHIRYEKTVSKETEIKFMTDGVLLKELRHDFFLTKYSVIIVDEAHERSVFSDVLIGLLSRIISIRAKRNDPLKLIIMSATIRVEDFMENPRLFKIPPFFIRIGSRQHKVQVHFNIQTPEDYIDAAYRKVCKIHRQLPNGAILVFLTGEKEIQRLVKMLRETFPLKTKNVQEKNQDSETKEKTEPLAKDSPQLKQKKKKTTEDKSDAFCALPEINLDSYAIEPLDTENLEHHQSDDDGETPEGNFVAQRFEEASPLHALPLYSVLPFCDQEKIFKPPPEGSRLCVVATNVAETSITIPGLKYVVDTGKVKQKVYNSNNGGISKFEIVWCSKASANQRAGRCGRTEGGHCYRLYSSSVFEHDLPNFSLPEIQRIPVDDILLQMKALGIDRVVEFPFPSPPEREALMAAEKRLVWLGALQDLKSAASIQELKKWEYSAKVTPIGKAMSKFPVSPRFAKMLLLAFKHNCIQHVVAIVCALTVPQLFMLNATHEENDDNDDTQITHEGMMKIGTGFGNSVRLGDVMVLLRAVAVFGESRNGAKFCKKYGIRYKAMAEVQKMYTQIVKELNQVFPESKTPVVMRMDPPNDEKVETIRKIMAACLVDHVARKLSRDETKDEKSLKNAYRCLECEDPVFIHPSSCQFERLPEFVVYNEIIETSKQYMKSVVEIEPEWLPAFSPSLCSFSAPLEDPPPTYDLGKDKIYCSMGGTFGRWQWEMPPINKEMPTGLLKYSWFCFFFLDGQIFSDMKKYRADMLSTPSVMLKSWAKLLPRTRYLLQAVITKEVDSRISLVDVWEKDPKYLLREVCEWLPVEKHLELEMNWPPKL